MIDVLSDFLTIEPLTSYRYSQSPSHKSIHSLIYTHAASLSTASTHPQPPIDPSTFASPIRPTAGTFHLDPSAPSPIPPPSAGKRELNEAAMALTWLAEACTAAQPPSPFQNDAYLCAAFRQKTTPQTAVTDSFLSTEHTRSSGLRGRRAASQRCTTVLREALQSELDFALSPRSVSAPTLNTQHRRAPNGAQRVGSGNQGGARGARRANRAAAGANTGERRSKGYSMNSRVGRAMVSILAFIEENQPRFKAAAALPGSKATSEGVPERIIRTEFGNNPDTSKALRFLVTEHKIVRNGQGGRRDPFSYTIAPANAALYSMAGTEVSAQHLVAAVAKVETSPATDASGAVTGNNPQEEEVDKARCHGGAALPSTATPRLTAAVAALAPSTGKWPQTVSRIAAETAVAVKKAQLQPRLSLGGAGPVFHDDGRVPVGVKRPAPTATPAVVVPAAKRPTATPPSAAASAMMAPGSAKWPSQLPTSQRLSTTSPLQGLSAAAHPAHGTMAFPRGGAATAAGVATFTPTAQVQQTQAALVQLHALQLLYQQQQQWVLAAQKVQEQMKEQQQAQPGQGEFPTATAEELVKLS